MSTTEGTGPTEGPVDWEAIENSPEFKELIARKRRFVLPATIFFLGYYTLFILLAGYAEDFMGSSIVGGFTVGYLLALTQFVMVWVLTWMYLRKAKNEFDPLEEAAVRHLHDHVDREAAERDSRATAGRSQAPAAGSVPTGEVRR